MRWPALSWFLFVATVAMLHGNWVARARAAPSPRNEDMFRELLKLDQMYSGIARPRFGKRAESNSNFAAIDYEGQYHPNEQDMANWLPVRR